VDPDIAVKGSIDPLGMLPLWTRYGREVVGNFTTVTTSVRGFTTLLLGYHYARRMAEERGAEPGEFIENFLKFEQMAAYSRRAWEEETGDSVGSIRGINRVRKRFADEKGKVRLGAGPKEQILSNQRAYGLWGLFSVAAEESGLIRRKEMRLADYAQVFLRKTVL